MKKHLLLTLALALLVPWATKAQTLESYGFTTGVDSSKWVSMTGATQILSPSASDGLASAVQSIGFSFNFAGTNYTQYSVNTDGNLRLGGTATGTVNYATPFSLANASTNNPKINAFGCDGYGVSGIHYVKAKQHVTDNDDTLLAVEFCMGTYNTTTRNELYKWQIHLYKNGNVDIVFPNTLPATAPAVAHQCGICASASDGWIIQSASNTAQHFTAGTTLTNSANTWFDANRYYSFVHPSNLNCPHPTGISVDNITATSATILWHAGGTESDWELVIGDDTYYPTDTFFTVSNLIDNTPYVATVRAICGTDDTSFASSTSFRTACLAISSLPYENGFESEPYYSNVTYAEAFPNCWTRINDASNTSYNYYPYVTNTLSYVHSGEKGLYWYHTTTSTYANNQYAVLPPVDPTAYDISDLTLAFWARTTGASYHPQPIIGVMTDPTNASTFTPVETLSDSAITTQWQLFHVSLASYTGTGNYIAIKWPRPSAASYMAIDDIYLTDSWCDAPGNVFAMSTSETVTLTWEPNGNTNFMVVLGDDTIHNVTDTTYTFTNLNPDSLYTYAVHTECTGSVSPRIGGMIRTKCPALTSLPYENDFEDDPAYGGTVSYANALPACWSRLNDAPDQTYNYYPYLNTNSTYVINGTKSLYWYHTTTATYANNEYAILPEVDPNSYSINNLTLSFYAKTTATATPYPQFIVGVMEVPEVAETFVPVDTIDLTSTATLYSVSFADYTGTGSYIAIRCPRTSAARYASLDDIFLTDSYCDVPANVTASSTSEQITLTWEANGGSSFTLALGEDTIYGVTDTTYTFTGLDANTLYNYGVATECSSSTSLFIEGSIHTQCGALTVLPLTENFDGVTGSTATSPTMSYLPNCWSYFNHGTRTNYMYCPYVYNSSTYAHSGTNCIRFYSYNTSADSTQYLILPPVDSNVYPINTLQLSFWLRAYSTSSTYHADVIVGVMTNPMDESTFVPVATFSSTSTTYARYECSLGTYTGNNGCVALKFPKPTASSSYEYGYVDDITLEPLPPCPPVANLHSDNVSVDWANISWTAQGDVSTWVVEYDSVDFIPGTGTANIATVNDTTYMMTDLDTGAIYYVYVRSDCGGDTSNFVGTTVRTLSALPAEVPYSCNFEGDGTNGWELVNGTQTNYFMVGTATNNGGSKSLYVTNNGTANAYTISTTSFTYATRTFNLIDTGEYAYTFDWKASGESNYDYLRAWLAPASASVVAGFSPDGGTSAYNYCESTPQGWIDLGGKMNLQSSWQNQTGIFNINQPGTYTMIFMWANDGSGGTQPPAAIDNVSVVHNVCASPSNLVVTDVTSSSITVAWHAGSDETSWQVSNGTDSVVVNDTTYTFNGLDANTSYPISVTALCGSGDASMTISTAARTACGFATLPLTEDFDGVAGTSATTTSTNILPPCWDYYNDGTRTNYQGCPYVYNSSTYAHSGTNSIRFYSYNSSADSSQYLILPAIDTTETLLSSLQLTFWLRGNSTSSSYHNDVIVGVMTDATDESSFIPYDTILSTTTIYEYHEINFNSYTGPQGRVTLMFPKPTASSSYNYGYVDDITLGPIPDCPYVEDLTVSDITTTSCTVSWTDTTNTGWNIEYDTVAFTPGTGHMTPIHVTDTFYLFTGLAPTMVYNVYVYPDCPDGIYDRHTAFSTLSVPATVPYSCNFEAPGNNGWDLYNGTQHNYWTVGNATNNGGSQSLYITNNGTSYTYDGSESYVFAVRNFELAAGSYVCSFDWKCHGESTYDFLRAAIVPSSTVLTPGSYCGFDNTSAVPAGGIALDGGSLLNLQDNWQNKVSVFSIDTAGSYQLVFLWRNDGTVYNQPPAAIDNISLTMNTCALVDSVTANVFSNSIDLNWVAGGTETSWLVIVGNDSAEVNTTSYTATGLTSNTDYTVSIRAICSVGDTSFAVTNTFHTPCTAVALPYSENFDSYTTSTTAATGVHVDCWPYIMTGSATYQAATYQPQLYYSTSNAHSGSYSLRLYGNSYTMLPPMPTSLDSLQITFWDYTTGASYLLEVGVMEGNTFVPVQTITTPNSTHMEHTVYLGTYTGNSRIIAFRNYNSATTTYYSYHYIDNVVVDYRPSCTPVIDIHSLAVGIDSLTVDWTDLNASSQWLVSIVPSTGTGAVTTTVSSHPITFSGLTPNTEYTVSVRPICSAVDTGDVASATFHTLCHITTLPYTDNFDSYTTSTTAATGVHADCWDYIMTGTATYQAASYQPQVYYSSSNAHSGSYSLRLYGESYTMLPPMPTSLDSLQLTFWDYTTGASYLLEVGVMEDSVFVPIQSITTPNTTHMEHTVYFGTYTGTSRVIAFRNYNSSATTYYSYHYIDNIEVDYLPTCPPVVGVTSVGSSTSSINVDWTDQATATQWQLRYGLDGSTSTTTVTVNSHPYTITGLDTLTAYAVSVRPICSATDTGDWCPEALLMTNLCDNAVEFFTGAATGTNNQGPVNNFYRHTLSQTIIDSAELVGLSEISHIAYSYNYATAMTKKTDVSIWLQPTDKSEFASNTDAVALNPATAVKVYHGSLNCSQGWNYFALDTSYVWDGQSNLLVIVQDNSGQYDGTSYHFDVTSTADYKYLIYYRDGTAGVDTISAYNPSTFTSSTAYRYQRRPTMKLVSCGMSGCRAPVVDTVLTGETSAVVSWTGIASNYEVAAVAGNWVEPTNGTPVTGRSYTFTGLIPGTQYAIGVRAVCADDIYSEWFVTTTTTIEHPCYAPTNVTATDITLNGATIGWTAGDADQTAFQIRYSAAADTTVVDVTTNPYTLAGLLSNTEYSVAVRAVCGEGNYSDWSAAQSFTTESCQGVSNVNVGNITPTSVTVTWNGSANSYEVAYGIRGISVPNATHQTVNGTSYTITGLDPETMYDVFVRSVCGENIYSDWSDVTHFATAEGNPGDVYYTLTLNVNDATMGSVNGGGSYLEGTTVTITATPFDGYHFVSWSNGDNNAVTTVVMNDNMTLTATFAENNGIDDVDNSRISLYPNPASSTVTLMGIEGAATVTVVDMNGREVYKANATEGRLTINVSDMAQGAYFVRITGEQVNAIRKLIVR